MTAGTAAGARAAAAGVAGAVPVTATGAGAFIKGHHVDLLINPQHVHNTIMFLHDIVQFKDRILLCSKSELHAC
jgi:hypothetical protein